jgi:hypothetical protein
MRIWSIGIYCGETPFSLHPFEGVCNPVLTHEHVTDFPASFVADPFMVERDGTWHMFFEVMHAVTRRGAIGLAVSSDLTTWVYQQIVLQEPFHLSYPYVFEWQGEYFMTPETLGAGAVGLYRADPFPTRWVREGDLVQGVLADPSPFRHRDGWWMFACGTPYRHDSLRLYFSRHLDHGWQESQLSPLVSGNSRIARPAGRVTPWEEGVIRYAQDCYPTYGTQVRAFLLDDLASGTHLEVELSQQVLTPDAALWTSSGMHHADPHCIRTSLWMACVDGSQG